MGLLWWCCFSFGLVLVLLGIFDGLGFWSMAWVFSIFFGLIIGIFLGIFENRWRGFLIGGLGIFDVFLGWSSTFFWVFSTAWVSNRRRGFLIDCLGLLIGGLGGGCGRRCWLQLVWWFVCVWLCWRFDGLCLYVCVWLCVWWWVWIGWSVYHGCVCVCGFVCWTGARGWGRKKGKKMTVGKRKTKSKKKWWLEKNNKEKLKNNILIKI